MTGNAATSGGQGIASPQFDFHFAGYLLADVKFAGIAFAVIGRQESVIIPGEMTGLHIAQAVNKIIFQLFEMALIYVHSFYPVY
jgi:hypothetical protein